MTLRSVEKRIDRLSTKRYVARWALKPVMVLSVVDADAREPRARVVDRSLMLGHSEVWNEREG